MRVLASGSKGNAYTLDDILIDCGIPFDRILKRNKFEKIKYCLLSHWHGDHSKAVNDVIKHGIKVYASRDTFASLKLKSKANCYAIRAGGTYELGDWTVYPYEAEHCDGALYFVLEKGTEKILFSTEELLNTNIEKGLIDPARINAVTAHMSIESCCDWLSRQDLSKVRSITLLHLSENNAHELQFINRVQKLTGIPTYGAGK
jgi:glyoxylase-like metal-dependent hydrolase (beta-lactamase superfamily II)